MKFLNYIHNLRGVAILYITIIHTIAAFNWDNAPHVRKILNILLNNGSVIFVFIGGYLFQHLSYKYEIKRYLITKLKFVVLPYLIWSVPAILFFVWVSQRPDAPEWFYQNTKSVQVALFYLTGKHLVPFWFIPMIVIFYLVSPLIIWLDRNNWLYWLLPVWIAISLIVSRGYFPHVNFVHFFSVYVIGMFFSKFREQTMDIVSKNAYLCVSLLFVIGSYFLNYFDIYYIRGYVEKLILCTVYLSVLFKFDHIVKNRFSLFANYSFGMYFIHAYYIGFIKLVYKKRTGDFIPGNWTNYIIFTLVIIALTIATVYIAKKIFRKKSRYIIGS